MAPKKPEDVKKFARNYLSRLTRLLDRIDLDQISEIVSLFERTRLQGGTIFLIGNGGSAATASHMALDLSFCTRMRQGPRMRAISLTDSSPYLTAAANDLDYKAIFEEQLKGLLHPEDIVIAISASGNSPNILRAVEYANERNAKTIGFVGFDGGRLKDICSIALHVESEKGDYGPVEDLHMILDHLITAYLIKSG